MGMKILCPSTYTHEHESLIEVIPAIRMINSKQEARIPTNVARKSYKLNAQWLKGAKYYHKVRI